MTAAAERVAITETHCAVVVFVGDCAYKLKKPVDLGFLDFRTGDARRQACEREVELNRRLAPDVYLGVADVTGPDGEPCDHLVVMRRMPASRRLSHTGQVGVTSRPTCAGRAAGRVPRRGPARSATAAEGSREAVRERWQASFERDPAVPRGRPGREAETAEVERLARRYLGGRGSRCSWRVGGRAGPGRPR